MKNENANGMYKRLAVRVEERRNKKIHKGKKRKGRNMCNILRKTSIGDAKPRSFMFDIRVVTMLGVRCFTIHVPLRSANQRINSLYANRTGTLPERVLIRESLNESSKLNRIREEYRWGKQKSLRGRKRGQVQRENIVCHA